MKRFTDLLIKLRHVMLILFIACVTLCAFLIPKVGTNYDMSKYLGEDSLTRVAIAQMESEFGTNGSAQVLIKGITVDDANRLAKEIGDTAGVKSVIFDNTNEGCFKDGNALYKIFLVNGSYEQESKDAITAISGKLDDYDAYLTGAAVESMYLQKTLDRDMTVIMLIACGVIALILFATSTSWVDPLMFAVILAGAIVMNLGTNVIFGEISFVTKSICAILQLALSMDYSIMLLHRYNECKKSGLNDKEAVSVALVKSFSSISGSSITTVAGLVALMFMSYTLGYDIGMVLAKGVIISLLTVFLFMPPILLIFAPLINKTKHKSLYVKLQEKLNASREKKKANGKKVLLFSNYQYKARFVVPCVFLALVIFALAVQPNIQYSFTAEASANQSAEISVANSQTEELFGKQNTLVIIVPSGDYLKEAEIDEYIRNYSIDGNKVINGAQSLVSLGIVTPLSKAELFEMFGAGSFLDEAIEAYSGDGSIMNFLSYLVNNNYITNKTASMQIKIDANAQEVSKLFVKISKSEFTALYPSFALASDILWQTMGLNADESVEIYKILNFVRENQLVKNVAATYAQKLKESNVQIDKLFVPLTMAEASALYGLDTATVTAIYTNAYQAPPTAETTLYCYQLINAIYVSTNGAMLADEYAEVQKVFTAVSYQQFLAAYPFGEDAAKGLFLTYNKNYLTDTLSYYQVLRYIEDQDLFNVFGSKAQSEADVAAESVDLAFTTVTEEYLSALVGVDSDVTSGLYSALVAEYGETVKLYQALEYVSSSAYIKNYGEKEQSALKALYVIMLEAAGQFESEGGYSRLIYNIDLDIGSDEAFQTIADLRQKVAEIYPTESYLVSESASYLDIKTLFSSDATKTNLISFFAILLIIMLTFKSLSIPVFLTLLIQGAIWITMSINVLSGTPIFFIGYLIVVCIQLGATVDYAILMTSRYMEGRATMDRREAISYAFDSSIMTILTSGSILVVAAYIVGLASEISIISMLGLLLSRGCLISVLSVVFVLPEILLLFDKLICRTTIFVRKDKNK